MLELVVNEINDTIFCYRDKKIAIGTVKQLKVVLPGENVVIWSAMPCSSVLLITVLYDNYEHAWSVSRDGTLTFTP